MSILKIIVIGIVIYCVVSSLIGPPTKNNCMMPDFDAWIQKEFRKRVKG